jgi:thiamine-monophosphate kinase
MREFEILKHIYAANSAHHPSVLIPPGDDMGMVQVTGSRVLAAVDQLIDGRHVNVSRTPLDLVGRKAITRSLSDIAAMAAVPIGALVAATLPADFGEDRAQVLFDAMRCTAHEYECPLFGGDLAFHQSSAHPLVCSVTVLAEPLNGRVVERRGARMGDLVCVTGPLGGAYQADGMGRHLTFEPRIQLAQQLALTLEDRLHAMIDISDGLGRDASHIAELSGVQIVLDSAKIPCNPGCDWRRAVGDGEDYELCFAAAEPIPQHIGGTPIWIVGQVQEIAKGDPRLVIIKVGSELIRADELGWQHQT